MPIAIQKLQNHNLDIHVQKNAKEVPLQFSVTENDSDNDPAKSGSFSLENSSSIDEAQDGVSINSRLFPNYSLT